MRTGTLNKLSARGVKAAGDGMHSDGGGLFLRVKGEARSWVFRFTVEGRKREMGLGSAGAVSLASAREKAAQAREALAAGRNPLDEKPAVQAPSPRRSGPPTFRAAARAYIANRQATWSNPKHAAQWSSSLDKHAAKLMPMRVDEVTTADVVEVLQPIWMEKRETASRVRQRIERILGAAIALGHRPGPNPAALRDGLDLVLPDQRRGRVIRHHAAVPVSDAPEAFRAILAKRDAGVGYQGLITVILTGLRSGEVRRLEWGDLDGETLTIPAERMKARRPHRAPISPAIACHLSHLPRWAGSDLVHPGQGGRPMSDMTLAQALKRSGYADATPHGWRSTLADWASAQGWPRDLAEDQLAHLIGNDTERAYRRGDFLDRRRPMMLAWSRYLLGLTP